MSVKPIYRIRGLPGWTKPPEAKRDVGAKSRPIDDHIGAGMIPWDKAIQAVGRPHINEYLHGYDPIGLRRLWPTFSFLHPRPSSPIKSCPVGFAAYLSAEDDDFDLKEMENEYEAQQKEIVDLDRLVKQITAKKDPMIEEMSPIATAFAAALIRGHSSVVDQREKILSKIIQHPAAAYVALQSGMWPYEPEQRQIIDALSTDPRLMLLHWKWSFGGGGIEAKFVEEALEEAPHLHCLKVIAEVPLFGERAWKNLVQAGEKNAMAAAFALGLAPRHELAEKWKRQLHSNPRAMYWAVRVGAQDADPTLLPFWTKFQRLVSLDSRWGYHWYRDFQPGEAYDFARRLWPDPWVIEIINDLKLSGDWVRKEYQALNIEHPPTDALLSAVLLWSADYVSADSLKGADEDN